MKRRGDDQTLDLFEVPAPRAPLPGALNIGVPLRSLLSDLLKACPSTRYEVAARMSELTGVEITKHQLDSWTAESRENWRFPVEYLPAFEVAVDSLEVTTWLADLRGARLSVGREALEAQLGKVALMRDALAKQEKEIRRMLGDKE